MTQVFSGVFQVGSQAFQRNEAEPGAEEVLIHLQQGHPRLHKLENLAPEERQRGAW